MLNMSKIFVESVKYGFGEGGFACGPIGGEFIFTIEFKKDNDSNKWLTVADVGGILTYYLDDEDRFERHLNADVDNDTEIADLNRSTIEEFDGFVLGSSVEDVIPQIIDAEKTNPSALLLRFVVDFIEASKDECDGLVNLVTGKSLNEIDIPISGAELGYREGLV